MGTELKQHPDGSLGFFSDTEGFSIMHVGGGAVNPIASTAAAPLNAAGNFPYRVPFGFKIPLTTGNILTAGAMSIMNNYGQDLMVSEVMINTTTAQTLTLTASIGTGSNSSVFGNNLIDAARVEAVGLVDNITDKGTSGKSRQLWAQNAFLTCTLFNTTANTFVGTLYATVMKV